MDTSSAGGAGSLGWEGTEDGPEVDAVGPDVDLFGVSGVDGEVAGCEGRDSAGVVGVWRVGGGVEMP